MLIGNITNTIHEYYECDNEHEVSCKTLYEGISYYNNYIRQI